MSKGARRRANDRSAADEHAIFCDCFLCRQPFRFGPHEYRGRRIPPWDIMVCEICFQGNWDGIVPTTHPHLLEHLKVRGIKVGLNAKGWIDWPA